MRWMGFRFAMRLQVVTACVVLLGSGGVDLTLEDSPLHEALGALASRTGTDFVYSDDVLAEISVRCHFTGVRLDDILDNLLASTPLAWRRTAPNRIVIYRVTRETSATFAGTVRSGAFRTPVPGARIHVSGSARVTMADQHGRFRLSGLALSTELEVSAPGYRNGRFEVLEPSESLELFLAPEPHISEHLRVSLGSDRAEKSTDLEGGLTMGPGTMNPGFGRDFNNQLGMVPGISSGVPGAEPGLSIRGSAPSENMVILDGIKIYQGDHAMGLYSAVNSDALSEIRIFKSAYPARYSDRVSGVLDLTVRGEDVSRFEMAAGLQRDMADLTTAFPLARGITALVSARKSIDDTHANQFAERVFARSYHSQVFEPGRESLMDIDRELSFEDLTAKLAWSGQRGQRVNISLFRGIDYSSDQITDRDQATLFDRDGQWGNSGWSLNWRQPWFAGAETEIELTRSTLDARFAFFRAPFSDTEASRWETRNSLSDSSFRLHQTFAVGPHQVETGLTVTSIISSYRLREASSPVGGNLDQFTSSSDQTGLYLQDTITLSPTVEGSVGFHSRTDSQTNASLLEPRLALSWRPGNRWSIRGAWGRFHQFVMRSADTTNYFQGSETWFLAGESLEPGKASHLQLETRYTSPGWTFDMSLWHKDVTGTLTRLYDPVANTIESPQTRDELEGVDLFLRRRLQYFSATLAYGFMDARVKGRVRSGESLDHPTDREIPHDLRLLLGYERAGWILNIMGRYSSGLPYGIPGTTLVDEAWVLAPPESPNAERLPDKTVVDASLRTSLINRRWTIDLGLSLENLTDQRNVVYRYYDIDEDGLTQPVDVHDFGFRVDFDIRIRY